MKMYPKEGDMRLVRRFDGENQSMRVTYVDEEEIVLKDDEGREREIPMRDFLRMDCTYY